MSYFSEQQMVFHSIFSDECIFSVETLSMQGETEKMELPDISLLHIVLYLDQTILNQKLYEERLIIRHKTELLFLLIVNEKISLSVSEKSIMTCNYMSWFFGEFS